MEKSLPHSPDHSGKFVLRIPPDLHRSLKEAARLRGISLNQVCLELLGGSRSDPHTSNPIIDRIIKLWSKDLEAVILFGSEARGESTTESDVDLLIVLRSGFPIRREIYRRWDEHLPESWPGSTREISPHFVTLPESPDLAGSIWLESALDGKVLWERPDGRVSRMLRSLREQMAEGRVRRVRADGHAYWIRDSKPLESDR